MAQCLNLPVSTAYGLLDVTVDDARVDTRFLPCEPLVESDGALSLSWLFGQVRLQVDYAEHDDVLVCGARIENLGDNAVTIRRAAQTFGLAPGAYSTYTQEGGWSRENRGQWTRARMGELAVFGVNGRTTQTASPFVALRNEMDGSCVAMHLIPTGDWRIALRMHSDDSAVLSLGAGDRLRYELAPRACHHLPTLLLYTADGHDFSAHKLHRYWIKTDASPEKVPLLVYNTWFHEFPVLRPDRLRLQLKAARELGCEVFVVDAGWFGLSTREQWSDQGDWREKQEYAFEGNMRAFADEVRAEGLAFGLWMEPETALQHTPAVQEHPEWFSGSHGAQRRYRLELPEARAYLFGEMCRLVDAYDLKWMKVDANQVFEESDDGFYDYYRHWYGLLAALRARYPDLYIEGCASGGMRADLAAMSHFDGFFLSDNVNPYDVAHISQGAMMRLPPGKLERWAVMRTADGLPEYPKPIEDSAARTIVPKEATWDDFLTVDPSFPLAVGLMGILGFSGDVHHMSERARALSRQAVAVFKTYRALLSSAVGYLLTPEAPFGRNDVWVGTQRSSGDAHLVYAFRMDARAARCTLHPRGLESGATYTLRRIFPEDGGVRTATGEQWMANGVPVALEPGCAAVYLLARQSASNPGRGKSP